MVCERCEDLLAVYKETVRLYTAYVERIQRLVGVDCRQAHNEAESSRLACIDAETALSEHRRQDHADLAKSLGRAWR